MSFDTLKIKELKEIAEQFAVDLPEKATKQQIILLLQEEGVDYDTYAKFAEVEKEEIDLGPEPNPRKIDYKNQPVVLVKMVRENLSYQWGNYVFTRENPYMPMAESDALALFNNLPGFVLATPAEVQEFYR